MALDIRDQCHDIPLLQRVRFDSSSLPENTPLKGNGADAIGATVCPDATRRVDAVRGAGRFGGDPISYRTGGAHCRETNRDR